MTDDEKTAMNDENSARDYEEMLRIAFREIYKKGVVQKLWATLKAALRQEELGNIGDESPILDIIVEPPIELRERLNTTVIEVIPGKLPDKDYRYTLNIVFMQASMKINSDSTFKTEIRTGPNLRNDRTKYDFYNEYDY